MCGLAVFAMQVFRLGFDWNVNSLCLCLQPSGSTRLDLGSLKRVFVTHLPTITQVMDEQNGIV